MNGKLRRWMLWLAAALIVGALAGCNFSGSDEDDSDALPPAANTPEVASTEIAAVSPEAATDLPPPTGAPVGTDTPPLDLYESAPTLPSTDPPPAQPTNPPAQPPIVVPPTFTPGAIWPSATPTLTSTPYVFPSATPVTVFPTPTTAPTLTNTPYPVNTVTPVPPVGTQVIAPTQEGFLPPPSLTPAPINHQPTAVAEARPAAQVCPTCGNLRLRSGPGTAGEIMSYLAAETPVQIIGRTDDNAWVQIVLNNGTTGWVASRYLEISIDLGVVSVTGTVENAPPPAPAPDAGAPAVANVISGISSNARQIFLAGQANGNRAGVFSKVGDSITYSWAYLYPLAGDYNLGASDHLAAALSFFSGPNGRGENPFGASPIAAHPGWRTVDVLTPGAGAAKSSLCRGDETPLACEYRTAKPSVALIMLGTNDCADASLSLDMYRANLRQIVQYTIDSGVIPVLSTIPDLAHPALRDCALSTNQIIITTARAYDVPLLHYWQALQGLPGRGLSADGVHPSESPDDRDAYFDAEHLRYGFTVRNLTALQMLYELYRQVLYDGGTSVVTVPDQPPANDPAPVDPAPVDPGPVDPATYSCPGAPPIRLQVGTQARVTPGMPNKMRSAPGLDAVQVGNIPGEAVFNVVGGPHCADGFTWWQVEYEGTTGWTASGDESEYWVEPLP